jgi:S-adenosylmethionine synthetase
MGHAMTQDFVFTSESVTEGHPDKLCDRISDAIVDGFLRHDPYSKIVAECAVATGIIFIAARFRSLAKLDIPNIARQVVSHVGYDREGFDARTCSIMTTFDEIPANEQRMVDEIEMSEEQIERLAADNQVTVFGFACDQTPALMPLPIWLAHKLARRIATVRLTNELSYLAPDGKTQVAVEFRDRRPARIHSITLIAALDPERAPQAARVETDLRESVAEAVFADEPIGLDDGTAIFVNPGGPFYVGGPSLHAGLTGRKNGIDTYGEFARQSGAALSGKDPSRIDRIGAYAARYAAKNIVAAGLARECEVQLSYTIGMSHPVSVQVNTFGTGAMRDEELSARLCRSVDFRPAAIVRDFNLRHLPAASKRGFFVRLAAYGQVGRLDMGLPWERTDICERLAD